MPRRVTVNGKRCLSLWVGTGERGVAGTQFTWSVLAGGLPSLSESELNEKEKANDYVQLCRSERLQNVLSRSRRPECSNHRIATWFPEFFSYVSGPDR